MTKKKEKVSEVDVQYSDIVAQHNKQMDELTEKFVKTSKENEKLKSEKKQLADEVSKLKSKIGGYITATEKQKKEISTLRGNVDEAKLVVQHLIEEKKSLASQVNDANKSLDETKGLLNYYKANYEHFIAMPWYKRIFAK